VALVGTKIGDVAPVLRYKEDESGHVDIKVGVATSVQDGKALAPDAELVLMTRKDAKQPFYNVDVIAKADGEPQHSGPARVTTEDYRRGWDRIFAQLDPDHRFDPPPPPDESAN